MNMVSRFVHSLPLGAMIVGLVFAPSLFAQESPTRLAEPEDKTLTTRDGVALRITYFASNLGKESPAVILLHQKSGNRFVWKEFARSLQKVGIAVVTIDLRLHGESRPAPPAGEAGDKEVRIRPADFMAMVSVDLPTVKQFLISEHHAEKLNINKLGIVGPESMAPVAMLFAQVDWAQRPYEDNREATLRTPRGQDVRAVVLISPDGKVPGLPNVVAASALRDLEGPDRQRIAFFLCTGSRVEETAEAKKIGFVLQKAEDADSRVYTREFDSNQSGTGLLGKTLGLEESMRQFFTTHLKKSPGEWRNRKPRLQDGKAGQSLRDTSSTASFIVRESY